MFFGQDLWVGKGSELGYDHQVPEFEGEGDDGLTEATQAIAIGSRDLLRQAVAGGLAAGW